VITKLYGTSTLLIEPPEMLSASASRFRPAISVELSLLTVPRSTPTRLTVVGTNKGPSMNSKKRTLLVSFLLLSFLGTIPGTAGAQSTKVQGLIKSRSGEEIILSTSQDPNLIVMLTDSTDVGQVEGMLKARSKRMSMAALIPGLPISVEGDYNSQNVLVATKVRFKGNDFKQAQAISAGMHDTKVQAQQNTEELAKHNAELKAQNEALQKHQAAIAANKAAVDAAIARFGQLDDYYIMDEVTVYFGNGKTNVEPQYSSQLTTLSQNAAKVNGYMIEVKGYASAVGSAAVNQKLSEERAQNVVDILLQQGKVPLTRMLAPGAMGESDQIGSDKTKEGEAENRRVVVRVLQNKAIAGIPAS
jgi:outer membrane protein OmpA-like peptidoglycan-associated protein